MSIFLELNSQVYYRKVIFLVFSRSILSFKGLTPDDLATTLKPTKTELSHSSGIFVISIKKKKISELKLITIQRCRSL